MMAVEEDEVSQGGLPDGGDNANGRFFVQNGKTGQT